MNSGNAEREGEESSSATDSKTRLSFIRGLQNGDHLAWQEFFDLHYPKLLRWARSYGASNNDAEDFVGELLKNLVKQFERFEYDPKRSFRAYTRVMLKRLIAGESDKNKKLGRVFSLEENLDLSPEQASESILEQICQLESESLAILAKREILNSVTEEERTIWMAITEKTVHRFDLAEEFKVSESGLYRKKGLVDRKIKMRYEELSGGAE